jgi:hypothetical protein
MREKTKKTFSVSVERQLLVTGKINIEADSAEEAEAQVRKMMDKRELQTADPRIVWDEPEHVDWTFQATGDVDEA